MDVFDLALDLNDKEWFMHLHKVVDEMKNSEVTEMTYFRAGNEYTLGIDWMLKTGLGDKND